MSYSREVIDPETRIVTKTIYDENHNIVLTVVFSNNHPARELVRDAQASMKKRQEFEKSNK